MQQCSLRGCVRLLVPAELVFDFQSNSNELYNPKDIKL